MQAHFRPGRGEYGRHDTGIVSTNTAEVNGANPDLKLFPRFRNAQRVQSYAELQPSDCLYLPNGWHHHVCVVSQGHRLPVSARSPLL